MTQVDLEAFVSSICAGGSDPKTACETLADDPTIEPYKNYAVSPTDFPPESYFLSKDARLEWLSDNALFERKDSQRGNSGVLNSNPSSQRFSLKSKASIIGLPKPQKAYFNEVNQWRNGCRVDKNRLILKRVGSRLKTDPSLLEPSSPKVSCIGRVRSRRERSRQMHRQKSARVDPYKEKANRVKRSGFMASFRAIFRIGGGCKDVSARGTNTLQSSTYDVMSQLPPEKVEEPAVVGLGGMRRFASGRRADLFDGC